MARKQAEMASEPSERVVAPENMYPAEQVQLVETRPWLIPGRPEFDPEAYEAEYKRLGLIG